MNVTLLTPNRLDHEMEHRLQEFEALFSYPLSSTQFFRIAHGPCYTCFYESQGESFTWIVHTQKDIIATVSSSIRPITMKGKQHKVAYIGDLKIHPDHQGGPTLFTIAKTLHLFLRERADFAYGVVMNGTKVVPSLYTGRLGIPSFEDVASIYVLRFDTHQDISLAHKATICDPDFAYRLYQSIHHENGSSYYAAPALHTIRSQLNPIGLEANQSACGILEDTRKAKRLFLNNRNELVAAHLSYFAFKRDVDALRLIQTALYLARSHGFPALFLVLSKIQYKKLESFLCDFEESLATIYATDTLAGLIPINTSEI